MAVCSFAVKKLIPPGSNDPRINARVAILHVAVSMAASLFSFFRWRSGGIESHFYITWTGKIEQYRDTAFEADANFRANPFAVSIETAGFGSGKWNPLQRKAIQRLLLWLNEVEGIPLRKCDRWDGSGVGFHIQFGAPGWWTPVAKSCPGPDRIRQFNSWLVPWMRTAKTGNTPTPKTGGSKVSRRMNPRAYSLGARGTHVTWLDRRLIAHGFDNHHDGNGYQPGPHYTRHTRANVRAFQRAQGWTGSDADGFPGISTLRRLRAKPKPRPKPRPKPKPKKAPKPTRITRARERLMEGLKLLDEATEQQGRDGWVRIVADDIREALRDLPRR